jgi:hypothetical protein
VQLQRIPQSFFDCLNGTASSCPIPEGIWDVDGSASFPAISIQRSVTVPGGTANAGDTVLRRKAGSSLQTILSIEPIGSEVIAVTIEHLTIDGNRWNLPAARCVPESQIDHSDSYIDVKVIRATALLKEMRFVNAPNRALWIDGRGMNIMPWGPPVVLESEFGEAGEEGKAKAIRGTAVFIQGPAALYYNRFHWAGTAAINVFEGQDNVILGNDLFGNRYEFGQDGGQLYLQGGGVSGTFLAGNIIDGNRWTTDGLPVNGCGYNGPGLPTHVGAGTAGIELYGFNHRLYNNEIRNHLGTGLQIGGTNPTANLVVSGRNAIYPTDEERYIRNNGYRGIWCLGAGDPQSFPYHVAGLILDHIRVKDNSDSQIRLVNVTGNPDTIPAAGFAVEGTGPNWSQSDVCIESGVNPIVWVNSNLLWPTPSNYQSCAPANR